MKRSGFSSNVKWISSSINNLGGNLQHRYLTPSLTPKMSENA